MSEKKKRAKLTAMNVRPMLLSLPKHEAYLYEAVARYVEHGKGSALVVGGIEIQQWPQDRKWQFRVAVHITGTKPVFAKKKP